MMPVAKRRLPSRALEAALGSERTRTATIAGSTRWTYEGLAATSFGCRRYSRSRVVARPILHRPDQRLRLAGQAQDVAREHDVLDLVPAADVVNLAVLALAQDQIERRAVVHDVQPVPHVPAVAVERQRLIVEGVGDEQRDNLLRVLKRAEVVRRPGDHDGDAVRLPVRQREQIAARLGGGVRIGWPQR